MRLDPESIARLPVHRVGPNESAAAEPVDDSLAVEEPLEIRLGHAGPSGVTTTSLAVTMRTPGADFDLAAGFLFTEGIIRSRDDVARIAHAGPSRGPLRTRNIVRIDLQPGVPVDLARLRRNFTISSSCGVCGKASIEALAIRGCAPLAAGSPRIQPEVLATLPERLRAAQPVFHQTGGIHAAGLFSTDGALLTVREDVGRHNALDKLIGAKLLGRQLPLSDAILVLSGRIGFELVQKALLAGIPVVAAVGAPTSLAVELAREFDITLAGFLRQDGFNIYSAPHRLAETPRTARRP
jgi:FdhD protein